MLNSLEIKYIAKYREICGRHFLYNICDGGEGFTGRHSRETKQKISYATSHISEETRNKMKLRMSLNNPMKNKNSKNKVSEKVTLLHSNVNYSTKHKLGVLNWWRKRKNSISKE